MIYLYIFQRESLSFQSIHSLLKFAESIYILISSCSKLSFHFTRCNLQTTYRLKHDWQHVPILRNAFLVELIERFNGKKCTISTLRHISQIIISNDKKRDTDVVWSGCALLSRVAGAALHAPGWTARVVTRTLLTLYTRIPHLQDGTRRLQMRGQRLSRARAIVLLTRSIDYSQKVSKRSILSYIFGAFFLSLVDTRIFIKISIFKCIIYDL